MLWWDVIEGTEGLDAIHLVVEDACETAGLGREERPFRPHFTVSRIRRPVSVQALIEATPPLAVVSPVDGIVVLRSHRGNGLSRYELLERFVLRETRSG